LLELYANYLRVLAASNIGRRLRARVSPSDVVQETFFEAHRDFAKFNGHTEREFMAWLRRILVNNLARLVERHLQADKRDVRREVSLQAVRKSVERSTCVWVGDCRPPHGLAQFTVHPAGAGGPAGE
jgi:RNA polymerase sigma-70 factor (ECF subfamily)